MGAGTQEQIKGVGSLREARKEGAGGGGGGGGGLNLKFICKQISMTFHCLWNLLLP